MQLALRSEINLPRNYFQALILYSHHFSSNDSFPVFDASASQCRALLQPSRYYLCLRTSLRHHCQQHRVFVERPRLQVTLGFGKSAHLHSLLSLSTSPFRFHSPSTQPVLRFTLVTTTHHHSSALLIPDHDTRNDSRLALASTTMAGNESRSGPRKDDRASKRCKVRQQPARHEQAGAAEVPNLSLVFSHILRDPFAC